MPSPAKSQLVVPAKDAEIIVGPEERQLASDLHGMRNAESAGDAHDRTCAVRS